MKKRNMSVLLAGALIVSNTSSGISAVYANVLENKSNNSKENDFIENFKVEEIKNAGNIQQVVGNKEVDQSTVNKENKNLDTVNAQNENLENKNLDMINKENTDKYEIFKMAVPRSISDSNMTEHELKDMQGLESINHFKLKTDSNYEIALSHGNGDYTYLESASDLDEAINSANEFNNNLKSGYLSNVIPVVINNDGLIVYATEGIAKIVKMKDGQLLSQNTTINLYKDAQKTKVHTYISPGAVDDVPVIEVNGDMVKIEVSGFNGWIPMSDEKGDNLIMVPLNDALNLSFYQVNSNNELIHRISSDVQTEGKSSALIIGNPPAFMEKLKKYYSYDGMYFYDDINKLISDLKSSNHNNAVNSNNPYYNYYNALPGRSKTVYSASDLNYYIEKNAPEGSALIGTGDSFIKYQEIYGVNALMALGVAINESGFGKYLVKPNNIFGIKANDGAEEGATTFESVDECIKVFMNEYMSSKYYSVRYSRYNGSNLGNKNIGSNVNYASDPFWGEKAASHMYRIDKFLSGGKLKEYNNEQLGIYTNEDQVLSKDGRLVHRVLNERVYTNSPIENTAQVGDIVLISSEENNKYVISPDRAKVLRLGTHDWNFKGYINKSSVKLINSINKEVKINSLYGDDRYKTAIKVSNRGWQSADNAVIVNSGAIVDALSATPFAYSKNAPILLTQKETLNSDTKSELKRLKTKNVYIIGGTSVVPEKIVNELKSMGIKVERISGDDRYKTSLEVAKRLNNVSQVAVVNGVSGLPDAVSIAPVAAKQNMPIVLASLTQGIDTFNDYIKNNNIKKSYVIGSTNAINNSIANKLPNHTRLGGIDRNDTNAIIVENFYTGNKLNNVFVAKDGMKNSDQLIDALAVGVLAAKENSPVVIVGNKLSDKQKSVLSSKRTNELTQVGSGGNENAFNELKNIYK